MNIKQLIGLFLLVAPFTGCVSVSGNDQNVSVDPLQDELDRLDAEIKRVTDDRDVHQARIYRLEINADRWQFDSSTYRDAKRAWAQIDLDKEKIIELEAELEQLERQRAEFIRSHPKYADQ